MKTSVLLAAGLLSLAAVGAYAADAGQGRVDATKSVSAKATVPDAERRAEDPLGSDPFTNIPYEATRGRPIGQRGEPYQSGF
jgi:hypothetical protein